MKNIINFLIYSTANIDDVIPDMSEVDIKDSTCLFFILGAGASIDLGLATYRGPTGMYTSGNIHPETLLSHNASLDDMWRASVDACRTSLF